MVIFGDKDDKYKEIAYNLFINGIMDEKEYASVINKKEKSRMILKDDIIRYINILKNLVQLVYSYLEG